MFGARSKPMTIPSPADALPGRATPMRVAARHAVLDASLEGPWPGMSEAIGAPHTGHICRSDIGGLLFSYSKAGRMLHSGG